jgi:hypothetical protein
VRCRSADVVWNASSAVNCVQYELNKDEGGQPSASQRQNVVSRFYSKQQSTDPNKVILVPVEKVLA